MTGSVGGYVGGFQPGGGGVPPGGIRGVGQQQFSGFPQQQQQLQAMQQQQQQQVGYDLHVHVVTMDNMIHKYMLLI